MSVFGELGNTEAIAFASEDEPTIFPWFSVFYQPYTVGQTSMYSLIKFNPLSSSIDGNRACQNPWNKKPMALDQGVSSASSLPG